MTKYKLAVTKQSRGRDTAQGTRSVMLSQLCVVPGGCYTDRRSPRSDKRLTTALYPGNECTSVPNAHCDWQIQFLKCNKRRNGDKSEILEGKHEETKW